jgi:hypothetical protein
MEHTVYLDDATATGRRMLKELRRYRRGIRFEKTEVNGVAPEGYMTSEEFREHAVAKVDKFCDQHGIL